MKSKKYDRLTIEELTLLLEEAQDKLEENPFDSSANSDYNKFYNKFFNMIQEREREKDYFSS